MKAYEIRFTRPGHTDGFVVVARDIQAALAAGQKRVDHLVRYNEGEVIEVALTTGGREVVIA